PKPTVGPRWQIRPVCFEREGAQVAIGAGKNGDGKIWLHACSQKLDDEGRGPAGELGPGARRNGRTPAARARPRHRLFGERPAIYSAGAMAYIVGASKQSLSGTGGARWPPAARGAHGSGGAARRSPWGAWGEKRGPA